MPFRRCCAVLLAAVAGCSATPAPPAMVSRPAAFAPATRPAAVATFADAASGIAFDVPATWARRPVTGSTRLDAADPSAPATLTLDVPPLPFHIPGLIPIGLVASGYVDDERKLLPDAAGPAPAPAAVAGASARRVSLVGHDAAGRAVTDDAVLIVHGDAVYVLAADATAAARPAATAALDAAVASIRWTR